MYLAQVRGRNGRTRFFIRYSYQDENGDWVSDDLFDLGEDPEKYIIYVGARGYYFDSAVEEAISSKGVSYEIDELEEIFWPFLDPYIKSTLENFIRRGRRKGDKVHANPEELASLQSRIHPFDRRRLCFLKYGQINMEKLVDRPLAFFNQLLDKSRDEIEQMFFFMELELRPWDMRGYLYAAFDVPRKFYPKLSRFIPDVQPLEKIDEYFLQELCKINSDKEFFKGAGGPVENGIHDYLLRYLIQYFDISYRTPNYGAAGAKNSHRKGPSSWQPGAKSSDAEHLRIMGISARDYENMDDKELTRIYRRKAQDLHPDKGGDHDAFIALTLAYQVLIRRKTW